MMHCSLFIHRQLFPPTLKQRQAKSKTKLWRLFVGVCFSAVELELGFEPDLKLKIWWRTNAENKQQSK
jgi:hypothetical protein